MGKGTGSAGTDEGEEKRGQLDQFKTVGLLYGEGIHSDFGLPDNRKEKEGKGNLDDGLFKSGAWFCRGGLFPAYFAFYEEKDAFPQVYAALAVFRVCDGDFGFVPRIA